MKTPFRSRVLNSVLVLALLLGSFGAVGPVRTADAASLTVLSDTMSTLKISTASSHVVKFKTPSGATASTDTIVITFPSDFNFTGKTIGTLTMTHGASGTEATETLAASATGSAWGAVFSGTQNRVLTLTPPTDGTGAAAVAVDDIVIVTYDSTNAINPSTASTFSITIDGDFGDTGTILVQTLTDDQVVVTATVAQTLSFSISDNTIGFGTLSSAAARYATGDAAGSASEVEAHTLAVGTNALTGYTTTVKGATLTYGGASIDAVGAANTASSAGSEQFGIRATASGGSGAVSAPYAASGFAYDATSSTTDEVAASSAASSTTTYSVRYLANISSSTEAGLYTTTLTYVTTANF